MASLNKVLLMGNLTRDPEIRYTPNGQAVCDFGLAVNRRYSVNGQDREEVCFLDIVVWAKQAESCHKYLHKGSPVFIEGRLQYDAWEDKDGNKRSRLRITAERVQFLSVKSDGQSSQKKDDNFGGIFQQQSNYHQQQPSYQNRYGAQSNACAPETNETSYQANTMMPPPEVFDNDSLEPEDDIPF